MQMRTDDLCGSGCLEVRRVTLGRGTFLAGFGPRIAHWAITVGVTKDPFVKSALGDRAVGRLAKPSVAGFDPLAWMLLRRRNGRRSLTDASDSPAARLLGIFAFRRNG